VITSRAKLLISVILHMQNSDYPICQVSSVFETEQHVSQNCTLVNYSILSENNSLCVLVLFNSNYLYPTIYYVKLLKCPPGFSFDVAKKSCQCDKVLQTIFLFITTCNITDQTIHRPANSWIGSTNAKNSYNYHICLHCPFHYCLPYSSNLNFSTPDSQCQFNRSGLCVDIAHMVLVLYLAP